MRMAHSWRLQVLIWMYFLIYSVRAEPREKRVLNLFQIVRFPNDPCDGGSASKNGTCYTASECDNKAGTAAATCASGFGVCCVFTAYCGNTWRENCTYFESRGNEIGSCTTTVCRCSSNICQIRLDFDRFEVAGPTVGTTVIGFINRGLAAAAAVGVSASAASRCQTDTFNIVGGSFSKPVICGMNTGKHMYVDLEDTSDCVDLNFQLGASGGAWSVKVNQYTCDYENLAPVGCTEYYFTGQTGQVSTYNYEGGQHLANQAQSICVRRDQNSCRICYTTVMDDDFVLSSTTAMANGKITGCCGYGGDGLRTFGYDCVFIPQAETETNGASQKSEFCGRSKGLVTTGSVPKQVAKTICSTMLPFSLLFLSDNYEFTGANREANQLDKGFQLQYIQDSTNCP